MANLSELRAHWYPGPFNGMLSLKTPYSFELKEFVKHLAPGTKWDQVSKSWLVPEELRGAVEARFPEYAWNWCLPLPPSAEKPVSERLKSYQRRDAQEIAEKGCFLLQYDTGVGKTITALSAAESLNAQRILIVTPAGVVEDMFDEITKKWELATEDEICLQVAAKKAPEQRRFTICTYGLMKRVKDWDFDFIIFDELHYLLNSGSARSKVAAEISKRNRTATRVGLTATPVSSEIYNVWHQIEVLCPGRLGRYWQFVTHYFETDNDGWEGAMRIHGLKPDRAEELNRRLAHFSAVVRKSEIADDLPPCSIDLAWYGKEKWAPHKISLDDWKSEQGRYSLHRAAEALRIGPADNRIFVVYMRSTAEDIGKKLGIPYVHGGFTPKQRRRALTKAPCAVVTMDCIREGINYLTRFTDVHYLEVYPAPIKLIQSMGRFHRMISTESVRIVFHGLKGTSDEPVIAKLEKRLRQQVALWSGGVEERIANVLGVDEDDEAFLAELNEMVCNMVEDDGFSGYGHDED